MKTMGPLSIVAGAVFISTSAVLAFLMFFSESVLGIKFSNISIAHLSAFLAGGLVSLAFGSKLRLGELKKNKRR